MESLDLERRMRISRLSSLSSILLSPSTIIGQTNCFTYSRGINPRRQDTYMTASSPIDILIFGAGWTSTFLIPLLTTHNLTYAATSRLSRPKPDTIPFEYDQHDSSPDESQFANLPDARTVLVTFPITVKGATERLVRLYEKTRVNRKAEEGERTRWIQLGTTSVWDVRIRVQSYHISTFSGHPDHLMVVRDRPART